METMLTIYIVVTGLILLCLINAPEGDDLWLRVRFALAWPWLVLKGMAGMIGMILRGAQ